MKDKIIERLKALAKETRALADDYRKGAKSLKEKNIEDTEAYCRGRSVGHEVSANLLDILIESLEQQGERQGEGKDYFELLYEAIPTNIDNCILPDYAREELANIINATLRQQSLPASDKFKQGGEKEREELIKRISVDFFRHWWNASGTNTEQGFDSWWKNHRDQYLSSRHTEK